MRAPNICDHRKCRRVAVAAYDLSGNGSVFASQPEKRHYEVCAKHDAEFFPQGAGWVRADYSERIKRELVPS